jgi:hypothetical protein
MTEAEEIFSTSNPADCVSLRMHVTGAGARQARTVLDCFKKVVRTHPERPAMRMKRITNVSSKYILYTNV